ncbi:GNAT family N-acetyltransferase [Mucilaginibacter gotjawali]|uniref:RimJ/RimL family protein N-acetyltransferase n=1 Tax=Mucilaginibacter gotjawali TaxID=1550579 RepID=A0A839SFV4_9SPHI|nr:GNAT family protein [Mucilaginibacter gotjawali]MBB3057151.1 RimJ/RimL family protein N-acetyltransferase [Mucilaginibacter gotjawali]
MELQGQGFKLRDWKTDDVEPLQKHADNPNIYSYLLDRFPHPYTMEAAKSWVSMMLNQNPQVNFVIDVDGHLAGVIGLEIREDVYRKTALLGYWISETLWGKGIMPLAIKLITTYAFENLGLIRIQAGVLSNNPRSMRALQKAGFTKEGVLKNNIIKNGIILDEHIFAALKNN